MKLTTIQQAVALTVANAYVNDAMQDVLTRVSFYSSHERRCALDLNKYDLVDPYYGNHMKEIFETALYNGIDYDKMDFESATTKVFNDFLLPYADEVLAFEKELPENEDDWTEEQIARYEEVCGFQWEQAQIDLKENADALIMKVYEAVFNG